LGIDRACSKLYDVKLTEQEDVVDSGQEAFADIVFDNTDFGKDWKL